MSPLVRPLATMAPLVDDAGEPPTVTYPKFDYGADLFVLYHQGGLVEYQTGLPGQFVRSDSTVDVRDAI